MFRLDEESLEKRKQTIILEDANKLKINDSRENKTTENNEENKTNITEIDKELNKELNVDNDLDIGDSDDEFPDVQVGFMQLIFF